MAIKTDKSTTDDELDFLEGGSTGSNPQMPDFTSGGSIFGTPGGLLGSTTIGADGGTPGGFLTGAAPTFGVPGAVPGMTLGDIGMFAPSGPMMGNTFLNSPSGLGPSGIDWSNLGKVDLTSGTGTPDMTDFTLQNVPFQNAPIFTGTPSGGDTVTTIAAGDVTKAPGSDAIQLPTMTITGTKTPNIMVSGSEPFMGPSGPGMLGGVSLNEALGGAVQLDPFYVAATKPKDLPTVTYTGPGQGPQVGGGTTGETTGATTLPTMTVTDTKIKNPPVTTPDMMDLLNQATANWGKAPIQLPAVTATSTTTSTVNPLPVTTNVPQITPPSSVFVPPGTTVPSTPTPTPTPTTLPPTSTPTGTPTGQTGTAGTGTTTTSSAMNQRDLEAELGKSLSALQKYQPQMLGMYKDIYNQFMPESLSAASRSALGQLQADEAKLARLRAGQLSPEDVRQSQQAAREAYGARGQAMGTGAIGAEILNRENIRQQREDQARAAYQQSMGNLFNTANLQTGNIFNPIASLISGSFNPLGAYPADVYGTNVNAQLARDIAQKNYEAAIKSAELSGAAQKQAGTTSAIGSILGAPGVAKGVIGLFGLPLPSCMPGDQCIDTPSGPVEIQNIKGGDIVIGYNGQPAYVAQVSSWSQDPFRAFFTFTFEDGSKFTVCDDHKILNIPAMEWAEGAEMGGRKIVKIETSTGHTTSYDLMTNQGGYQINGVPVNSMIPEIILAAAKHVASVNEKIAEITK